MALSDVHRMSALVNNGDGTFSVTQVMLFARQKEYYWTPRKVKKYFKMIGAWGAVHERGAVNERGDFVKRFETLDLLTYFPAAWVGL